MTKRLFLLLTVLMLMAPRQPSTGVIAASRHTSSSTAPNSTTGNVSQAHGQFGRHSAHIRSATHPTRKPAQKATTHKPAKKRAKGARKGSSPASGLAGVVRRDHRHALTGAALTCKQGRHSWHTKTDKHGSFRITLAPGRYACSAAAHGYKQATAKAAIKAHQVIHVTFTLAAAPKPRHSPSKPTLTPTDPVFILPTEGPTPPPSGPVGGETCTWTSTRALYVDTNAAYWAANLRADPTVMLTIAGVYPAARYASLQVYNAQGDFITGLADKDFPADPGTANPFAATRANRGAGRYTVRLMFGPAPPQPAAGTLYISVAPGDTVVLVYRVYLPDLGADQKGNVGLPAVTAVSLATGAPSGCPIPEFTFPTPVATATPLTSTPALTGTAVATATTLTPTPTSAAITNTTPAPFATPTPFHTPLPAPPATAGFTRLSGDQLGGYDNPDAAYLVSPLPPRLGVYVIHFKPPTAPHTLSGGPLDPNAQVRYWSICVYSVIGPFSCTADEQAQLDANGQLTVVLGSTFARPPNVSSLSGAIWIDLGAYFIAPYKVIIRELLPAQGFSSSIFAVPLGAAPDAYMGAYAPTLTHCSTVQFQANLCA